ncbi:Serine/threonine-protein kinase PrkC [Stieleria maiorica]|uniref:Serine/threonine-protein kinase PrkC n=1 Tax=Stieleria maiorica TaxID=2795974 RepID=A0A5B9M894_9BACT|nr:serine/threonine-protein kinase [Stieleria maiorica]QEF96869.1 Serine/threonine-protein kinase PrkC [Stieleria maiorica]
MNHDVPVVHDDLEVTHETLRAFAKGKLDEETERQVMAVLETRPELAAEVAAISVDSVIEKLRRHSEVVTNASLSSQLRGGSPGETELSAEEPSDSAELPNELAALTEFKVLKEIGRGGMGVVYLAKHELTGRKEVLKVLNERLIANREARKRFDQEIKCIASMNHESIVRCHTVKQMRDALVLCMEYVPGKNLYELIATNGPLPIQFACGVAVKVCLGLQHAMNNGLVHRDIKPSNLMIYKADGRIKAKILDFGLARLTVGQRDSIGNSDSGLTDNGTLLGTLEYIAPEQCRDAASADIRSDIYSLGCTLYHMLAGHPPFSGSIGELVLAHTHTAPPAIDHVRPEVPGQLAGVVTRMLAKDPDQRYQTPAQAADALRPFALKGDSTDRAHDSNPNRQESIGTAVDHHDRSDTSVACKPAERVQPKPQPRSPRRMLLVASGVVIVGLAILLMQLVIKGRHGTIVIDDLPSDARVLVDGDRVTVSRDGMRGRVTVEQGDHELKILVTGKTLLQARVHLRPGGETSLRVEKQHAQRPQPNSSPSGELVATRLPDLRHTLPHSPSFTNLLSGEDALLANFDTEGVGYQTDRQTGTIRIVDDASASAMLTTRRHDYRNFHLRIEMMIESSHDSSRWNQHFVLRAMKWGSDKTGWRVMMGGNRPHAGVLHQVAPFGLMGIKVRPFPGYPDGNIGVPQFEDNRLSFYQSAPQSSLSRDEFHTLEYIVYGKTIEGFLDGRFVFSAIDKLDRANRGAIVLAKPPEAADSFREFSILELGDDTIAEEYAKAMALALAEH